MSAPAADTVMGPADGATVTQTAAAEQSPHEGQRISMHAHASTSGRPELPKRPQQACDFTLLAACAWELRERWLPAKVDQVTCLGWRGAVCCVKQSGLLKESVQHAGGPGR